VQRALSRFSFSFEICTCFYKLQPRSLGVHGCGDKVHENFEGSQKVHGVRSGEELDKQQLMGTSKRTNWTHLWDPALTAQCSGVIFSRYVVTCMETCTSSHHRNLSAATGSDDFCALHQARSTNQGRGIEREGHLKIRFPCQEIRHHFPMRSVVVGRGKSKGSENLSVNTQC